MNKRWSAVGATFFVVALLLVTPAAATDTWDLTSGPIVVSYTLDLTQAPDIFVTNNWSQQGAVGLFSGVAGARMVGFLYDYDKNDPAKVEPKLDNDDKFNLQRPSNPGSWGEGEYDTNCATKVVGPAIGSGANYGIWFDRDNVDQWQAAMWGMINGDTYNTGGIYDVVLTFDRSSNDPGKGFVCATVNGAPTGFYTSWVPTGPQLSPYGLSFAATPQQMRTMELVTSDVPGIVISNVNVSGVDTYTAAGDCLAGESFVPSTGGTVSLGVVAGHNYQIDARGTYYAGGTSQFDIRADAEYSQDAIQRAHGDPWTKSVHNYETSGDILLDLTIDGQNVDWGDFSSTHEYSLEMVAGVSTVSFAFDVYDSYPSNNTGGLCVSLTDISTHVTAPAPTFIEPTCTSPTGNYTLPDPLPEGVDHYDFVAPNWFPGSTVHFWAVAEPGYVLDGVPEWFHTFTAPTCYSWAGFFRPVDNPIALNTVKAGQAIPVKFSLSGDQGLNIFAAGSPGSTRVACDAGAPIDVIEVTVMAGESSLSYDALTDTYTYVWKTDKAWSGTCRQLSVTLADGPVHLANFKFTK